MTHFTLSCFLGNAIIAMRKRWTGLELMNFVIWNRA